MKSETRGFLTEQDRKYLLGEADLTEGSEYNTRRRIRQRARQGFMDFAILFDHLGEDDRRELFEDGRQVAMNEGLMKAMRDTLAFIFEGSKGTHYLAGGRHVDDPWMKLLFAAVERVGLEQGYHVSDVSFDVEASSVNVEAAREKLDRGEKLNAGEIKVLLDAGEAELRPAEE